MEPLVNSLNSSTLDLAIEIVVHNDSRSSEETFLSLLSHAEELIDAGRVKEARRLLAQFIERKHLDSRMLPALAALYLRVGKPDQAVAAMRTALDKLGAQPELLNTFGLLLASLGRERESREKFEEALRLDATNSEALRNLAFALHRAGERPRAYAMLVRCFRAAPLSAELRLVCGALLELDGKLDEAANCYRDVMELSTVCEQVRLASQRLFALGAERPEIAFEDVILMLEEECDRSQIPD
jgi:tetratricopeptide (TPR) repeat protein